MRQDKTPGNVSGALNGLLNIVLIIPLLFFVIIKAFLSGNDYKK